MTQRDRELVKQLQQETGASIIQCIRALKELNLDYNKAKEFLNNPWINQKLKLQK